MKKETLHVTIALVIFFVIFITAIVLFTVFPNSNTIDDIATALLIIDGLLIFDLKFYLNVRPIWLGIVFSLILLVSFVLVSFGVHRLFPEATYLTGLAILFALAVLLSCIKKPLIKFLTSVFRKR